MREFKVSRQRHRVVLPDINKYMGEKRKHTENIVKDDENTKESDEWKNRMKLIGKLAEV